MNDVKKSKNQQPRHFRYVVLGTATISPSLHTLLNQAGGLTADPESISPITGTYLGALDRILEAEKSPLLVFYDVAGALLLAPLERNFSLDPRILWTPLSVTQESLTQALFQLRKQWILGTELTNSASQFEHLFQSGPHFRFLLDPDGVITKACPSALSLLGDRAQPGEMMQDLDDYPPGILGDFLDRARVLKQIQGEFVLTLPKNPPSNQKFFGQVDSKGNDEQDFLSNRGNKESQKKKLRIRAQFEFIGEGGPYDPNGYFLVTWYDISHQVSELKTLRKRIEQESMLSMIASRFIPNSKDIGPLVVRTLEDLSTFLGFGKARLLPVQTKAGNVLSKYCTSLELHTDLPMDLEPLTRYFIQKGRSIDPVVKSLTGTKNESQTSGSSGRRFLYGIWVPLGLATILEISVTKPGTNGYLPTDEGAEYEPENPETSLIIRMAIEMMGLFFARLDPDLQRIDHSRKNFRANPSVDHNTTDHITIDHVTTYQLITDQLITDQPSTDQLT